jgi:hypothetical protein
MKTLIGVLLAFVSTVLRSWPALQVENVALRHQLTAYQRWRTHLSLEMDTLESRPVQRPALGKVVQFPEVGGLHHHYDRLAA